MTDVVVRVPILRCKQENYERLLVMMRETATTLRPGIEAMPGLMAYYAGADEATHSLTSCSVWQTLAHAQQLDQFQPMLDAGKRLAAAGAQFERPIMNDTTMWRFGPLAASLNGYGCVGSSPRNGRRGLPNDEHAVQPRQ